MKNQRSILNKPAVFFFEILEAQVFKDKFYFLIDSSYDRRQRVETNKVFHSIEELV